MVEYCPHCRRVMPEEFVIDINRNLAERWGRQVRLTPNVAELAHALWKADGNIVNRDRLKAAIWGADGACWPQYDENSLSICTSKLREALRPLGIHVITVHGAGVRIEVDRKARP